MSAEHGAIIAATLIPLFTVQVRVVENEEEFSNKLRAAGRQIAAWESGSVC